ncbi:MAG: PLP-dependent aminotransferase family protein [Clostridiaceae bacterium]|nr:PLP-dependent aminotransferase family protein [Clostridiales bacterium]MDD6876788.1 PLP-dependent aminotransferase family protein [Clostridiaceae bacterium]MDY3287234.1 PLP-dependent aminotransferase family protein [Eubacteriales bacterium]
MNYNFASRIGGLKPSAIREILKVTQDPSVISFAAGNPAPEAFPVKEMKQIADELFDERAAYALQYGVSEGYAPLRELTAARLKEKYNIGTPDDDLIILSGGQQVMDLTAKCFLNEGDTILVEDPSFIGSLNCFRSYGAHLVGIPMEPDGIDVDALERALKTEKNVKLMYLIPTFQNPTGRVMSLAKRRRVLELSKRYDVPIIEDNPYYELRYSGEYVPTLKSLDTDGRVIYAGSYSKVLSPGIRLGFACANKEVISKLVVVKQVSDVHTNLFFQMIAAEYLSRYSLDEHIAQVCAIYREKRDAMADALNKYCADTLHFESPEGGLFLWCDIRSGRDGRDLCTISGKKGVAAVPGIAFAIDPESTVPSIRLNFSLSTFEQIDRGCRLLGEAARELG